MITTIRRQFKQSTYRYIIFFMLFAIVAGMVSSMLMRTDRMSDSWALRVNGIEISYKDFSHEVAKQSHWLAQIRGQFGMYADMLLQSMGMSTDPKTLAIETLIRDELMRQYAYDLGLVLHSDYISKSVNNALFARQYLANILPHFVFDQNGQLDTTILRNFLNQTGSSVQEFEKKIETALLSTQLMDCFNASCYVPLFDIKQYFIAKNLGKGFSYLTFSFDTFLAQEKKHALSNEELKDFYTQQNNLTRRYWVPEKRNGIMWKFNPKNYNLTVSEQEISDYYEDNKVKNYVLEPLKVEVQQISEKSITQEGVSLESVRKDLVADANAQWSKKWQSLKPFARGDKKGAFEQAAFTLQNEGDISSIIDTDDGKVFLRLVKRYPRTYKPLMLVRQDIKDILTVKKFKKEFARDIKALIGKNDQKALEAFTKEKSGTKELVNGIAKDESRISKALFELKKDAYTFYVDGDNGFIVMLTDVNERYLPDFDSIKDIVSNDLYEEKAHIKMAQAVTDAQSKAYNSSLLSLKESFNASYEKIEMLHPHDTKKIQELEKKEIPAREILGCDKVGMIVVNQGEKSSIVAKVESLELFDEQRFIAAQKDLESQLASQRMNFYHESLVASLRRSATIETNETILITGEEYSE